jgi:hypothetical protein
VNHLSEEKGVELRYQMFEITFIRRLIHTHMLRVPFTCPRVALPFSLSDAKIQLLETLPREGG